MHKFEQALEAKIPPNISTPEAKAYLKIKMALKLEYKEIEELAVSQVKLLQALDVGLKEAMALKNYKDKTTKLLTLFGKGRKGRLLVKQLSQGKMPAVEEEIVKKMTAGGKESVGNIKAIMDVLGKQGTAGKNIQRELGLVYWKRQFEDIIRVGQRAVKREGDRVYVDMADAMLDKIEAFGPARMKALMRYAPDYNDMKDLQRLLEKVASTEDLSWAAKKWRSVFTPGTWKGKFPERLMMGIAIGYAYKGMGAMHSGQAQGNR